MRSVDLVDELSASLHRQCLGDDQGKFCKLPPPTKRFKEELDKTGFTIFKPISDLGFYEWEPDLEDHSQLGDISANEIKRQLHVRGKPARLINLRTIRLPISFPDLSPQIYENKYPLARCEVAGIHVATKVRGLKLTDIDFVFFGGSTLSMLATQNESQKTYLVTKIPGTSVGIVAKDENYSFNLADPGFQFERLVTGRPVDEMEEPTFVEHMQVMEVGVYTILFIAKVDALKDGEPVEVTFSNPFYWDIKQCLQCVSTGSAILIHGRKNRENDGEHRGRLDSISIKTLRRLYEAKSDKLKEAEGDIVRSLDDLKQQLDVCKDCKDYEIIFSMEGHLELQAKSGSSKLLPSSNVVDALIVV
ncbi:hypothetical protein FisN_15Lh112 [Fistulifera solaris]|uniref:Uncharacterized protein n=1 Tax=Fistulifera solaris TaxID=1519565 RepID=A0A1Z5KAU9_FISSO|nr:hypothetical protein FisN_15Lh112 [Fistulifera solaris]|eukprot:GAX23393.1 hypothetical protein FisN_15Lh112 [Fistulifera solaris]